MNFAHHKRVNTGFNSVPRDVAGHLDYRRCVDIGRSSAVLRRGSEIPLRKQRDPQALAGQQLHERGSEAHQASLRHRRRLLRHGRTHPCAGASVVKGWIKMDKDWIKPTDTATALVFLFLSHTQLLLEHNVPF